MGDGCSIKTDVNLREFEKCAADRAPMGIIAKENGATITRMGMSGKIETVEANAGDKVYKGDIIKTPPNGSVAITLPDKSIVSAGPSSAIDIAKFDITPRPELGGDEVKRGTLSVISGKIATPIEGTTSNFSSPGGMGGVRG